MSNSRRASSPTTKKKKAIRPSLTQRRRFSEIDQGPSLIESSVVQNDPYDEVAAFAQTSAAIVAASSTIELPASARRYARTGAAFVRAHAVLPDSVPAPRSWFG